MASTSETGYNINIANLQQLIQYAQSLGASYNPAKDYLSITNLQALHTSAASALTNVQTAKAQLIAAVNARQSAYAPLKKLATRIINALDASDVDAAIVKDARTYVNKINNAKIKNEINPTDDGSVSNKTISTSRQSYNSLAENLSMLITLIANTPAYNPNETSLKVSNLQTYLQELHTANTQLNTALSHMSNARYTRDALQFMPKTGLVDISLDFKKYIKSLYGGDSHQYKTVSNIGFVRYKFTPSANNDEEADPR